MASFVLRKIDSDLWRQARLKAGSAANLLAVVERLLRAWILGSEDDG